LDFNLIIHCSLLQGDLFEKNIILNLNRQTVK